MKLPKYSVFQKEQMRKLSKKIKINWITKDIIDDMNISKISIYMRGKRFSNNAPRFNFRIQHYNKLLALPHKRNILSCISSLDANKINIIFLLFSYV